MSDLQGQGITTTPALPELPTGFDTIGSGSTPASTQALPAPPEGFDQFWTRRDPTPEEMQAQFEELLNSSNMLGLDQEEEAARVRNSMILADKMGTDFRIILDNYEAYSTAWTGEEGVAPKNLWEQFNTGLSVGYLQEELNELWNAVVFTGSSEERQARIDELTEQIASMTPEQTKWWKPQNLAYGTGQIIPNILTGMKEGTLYGLGLAGGTALATSVTGPGVLPSTGTAFLFGLTSGTAIHSFRQMTGAKFSEFSQLADANGNQINPGLARGLAITAGLLNAGIETLQVGQLAKFSAPGINFLDEAFEAALSSPETTKRVTTMLAEKLGSYAAFIGSETFEEIMQKEVDILVEEIYKSYENFAASRGGGRVSTLYEAKDLLDQLKELAMEGINTMGPIAMLGLPGASMQVITEIPNVEMKTRLDKGQEILQRVTDEEIPQAAVPEPFKITVAAADVEVGVEWHKQPDPQAVPHYRGTAITLDDPRVPDVVYHVATDVDGIAHDGKIRASGVGGLGGDPRDAIVSFTTDQEIANQLEQDIILAANIAKIEFGAMGARAEAGEIVVAKLSDIAKDEGWEFDPSSGHFDTYDARDWLNLYLQLRENHTEKRNPVFFSDQATMAKIDPDKVGILPIRKSALRTGALITDFDIGAKGLEEIRSYGDVPYETVYGGENIELPLGNDTVFNLYREALKFPVFDTFNTWYKENWTTADPTQMSFQEYQERDMFGKMIDEMTDEEIMDTAKMEWVARRSSYGSAEEWRVHQPKTIEDARAQVQALADDKRALYTELGAAWDLEPGLFYQTRPDGKRSQRPTTLAHRRHVEQALKEGRSVPRGAVELYPSLMEKYGDQIVKDKAPIHYDLEEFWKSSQRLAMERGDLERGATVQQWRDTTLKGTSATKQQVAFLEKLMEAHAHAMGLTAEEWLSTHVTDIAIGGEPAGYTLYSTSPDLQNERQERAKQKWIEYQAEYRATHKSEKYPEGRNPSDSAKWYAKYFVEEWGKERWGDVESETYVEEMITYMKRIQARTAGGKSPIHFNGKTIMSLDVSTDCPKRESGGCLYCYVETPRAAVEAAEAAGEKIRGPSSPKGLFKTIEYNHEILSMPDEMIRFINTELGGLRLFSFGDWKQESDPMIQQILKDAVEKKLIIKAITKQPEFVEKYADHPNLRINVSTDFEHAEGTYGQMNELGLRDLISRAPTLAQAYAWAKDRPNVKVRYVAMNYRDAMNAGADPRIDVLTFYHGFTGENLKKVWDYKHPELRETLGDKTVEQMAKETNHQKFQEAAEKFPDKICCLTGKCGTCSVCCGFARDGIPGSWDVLKSLQRGVPVAAVSFNESGRAVIRYLQGTAGEQKTTQADINAATEELAHIWRRDLMGKDLETIEEWLGVASDKYGRKSQWTVEQEEQFAEGLRLYLREGNAPTRRLAVVFAKFKEWVSAVWESISRFPGLKLTEEVRGVYDRMFATQEQLTGYPPSQLALTLKERREQAKETPLAGARAQTPVQKYQERMRDNKRVNKIIRNLKKAQALVDTGKLPDVFARNISGLLDNIDLVRRQKKTLAHLGEIAAWAETDPNAELPPYIIEKLRVLDMKDVRDFSIEDLEDLHDAVMNWVKQYQSHKKIRRNNQIVEFQHARANSIAEMKPPKELKGDMVKSGYSKLTGRSNLGKWLRDTYMVRSIHYDLLVEKLGGINSTMYDILYKGIERGQDKRRRYRQSRPSAFWNDVKGTGFSMDVNKKAVDKWLDKRVIVEGPSGKSYSFTRDERMAIYRHALNPDNKQSLLAGFGIVDSQDPDIINRFASQDDLDALLESLTDDELLFAGDPVSNWFEQQYKDLDQVFYEKNWYHLPKEDLYFPKRVIPSQYGGIDLEAEEALEKFKGQYTRPGIPKGMLEKRKRAVVPIYLESLTSTLNRSLMKSADYIGLEIPLSEASKLLYDKKFRAELERRYGRSVWKEIDQGLRDVAGEYRSWSLTEKGLMKLKSNFASAIFGVNIPLYFKQALSYPFYATYVKPQYLAQAVIDTTLHPRMIDQRHSIYSSEYVERGNLGFSKDIADIAKARSVFRKKVKLREKLTAGVTYVDRKTVRAGMQAAVLQVLDEFKEGTLSPEVARALNMKDADIAKLDTEGKLVKAYEYADYATQRTQPMFSPEHQSPMQRGSSLEQMFSMWSSFTNQAYTLMGRSIYNFRQGEVGAGKKLATVMMLTWVVNPVMVMAFNRLRAAIYDDEPQPVAAELFQSWGSYFFFIRDIINSATSKVQRGTYSGRDTDTPVTRYMNQGSDVLANYARGWMTPGLTRKAQQKAQAAFVDDSFELMLTSFGLPYQNVRRLMTRIMK